MNLKGDPKVSIPYRLKIHRTGQAVDPVTIKLDRREHFKILEGVNKGKLAYISVTGPKAEQHFDATIRHRHGAAITFSLSAQTLVINNSSPFNAFSGGGHRGFTAIKVGTYELALPAYPTDTPRAAYRRWSKHYNLWFRIGLDTSGSRFLHPGSISDGCVTVRQFLYDPALGAPPADFSDLLADYVPNAPGLIGLPLPKTRAPCMGWDTIVDTLILSRLSEDAVGKLVVVK